MIVRKYTDHDRKKEIWDVWNVVDFYTSIHQLLKKLISGSCIPLLHQLLKKLISGSCIPFAIVVIMLGAELCVL